MRGVIRAFASVVFALYATSAYAQTTCGTPPSGTVQAPTKLCYVASPDHSVMDLGTPVVSGYDIFYCTQGADPTSCAPVQQQDLGKPTPDANGLIKLDTTTLPTLFAVPVGQVFIPVIRVRGEDAGLSARYPAGNPFGQPSHQAPRVPVTGAVVTP